MGQLVFQATLGGQVNLVGPNTSSTFTINVPAVTGNMVTTGDTGTVTNTMLASSAYAIPGAIGSTTPNMGAFTTLSASSTVSGTGFSNYLASPPAIGGTAAAAGSFTTLSASGATTLSGGTANGVAYLNGSKVLTTGSALTYNGTGLGINTTASYPLDVNSNSTYAVVARLGNTSGNRLFILNDDGGNAIRYDAQTSSGGASAQIWLEGGSEQMRLTSIGLGIGTSSPSAKLHVYSSSGGTTSRFQNTGSGNFIDFYGASSRQGYIGSVDGTNFWVHSDSASGSIYFETNNTTQMTLNSSGNLGLGVTPSSMTAGSIQTKGVAAISAGYTVATLPTGQPTGSCAYVTNASTPVFGSTVVGGGAVTVPVFYNGSNWIVG